jgi:hypothetical protein
MMGTLACAIIGPIIDRVSVVLAGLVPLVVEIAWANLHDKHDLDRQLEQIRHAIGVTLFSESDEVYREAQRTLEEAKGNGGWETVRVYAPSGLWTASSSKDAWLATLARELGDSVGNVSALCGLPLDGAVLRDVAWPLLRPFANTPGTEIRYLPPNTSDRPPEALGFGMAVFENRRMGRYRVIFGFAGRDAAYGAQIMAGGFTIDSDTIGPLIADWFDYRVMRYCSNFVIRGGDPAQPGVEAKMSQQLEAVLRRYYPESVAASFR